MADTLFWEIHEVRKGMWAFFSWLLCSCWLVGQANSGHMTVFLWSFVLQCGVFMCPCAGAVLYYYFYKRTALRLGDPRFYKDSEWLRQEFSRTHWFRPKACGKCQKLGPTVWKRSSLHKLKSFWSSSWDQHWNIWTCCCHKKLPTQV